MKSLRIALTGTALLLLPVFVTAQLLPSPSQNLRGTGSQTVGAPTGSWLTTKLSGLVSRNNLNVISTPQATGNFAAFMASSRTSDNLITAAPHNVIAESSYMLQDNTKTAHLGWSRYTTAERTATAALAPLFGEENSIKNNGIDAPPVDPFVLARGENPPGSIIGNRVTSGWGPASNLISSYYNGNWNGGKARVGMVFGADALDTTSGYASALAIAPYQGLTWFKAASKPAWRMFYNSTEGSGDIVLGNNTFRLTVADGTVTPINATIAGVGINGQTPAYSLDVAGTIRGDRFVVRARNQTLSGCGTGAILAAFSSLHGGRFTTGTGTVTSCTLMFNAAYPRAAFCTITPANSIPTNYWVSAQTLSAFTISFGASVPSTSWQYVCMGS